MGIPSDDLIKRIDKAPVGLLIFSGVFEIIFISDTFRKIADFYHFKYPSENLNQDLMDFEPLREELGYLALGYSFEKEIKSISTPGIGKVSLVFKGIPFYEGDKFSGGVITAADIRLSASEEIVTESFHLQDVLKSSGDYIFITDRNGKIRFSSGRKNVNNIIQQNLFDLISPPSKKEFSEKFLQASEIRYSQKLICTTFLDKEEYECRIDPVLDNEGKPEFFIITFNAVSQIIKDNQQLRQNLQNSEKFRSSADSADEMIYIYDRELQLHYSNRKAENLPDVAEHFDKEEILSRLYNHPKVVRELEVEGKFYNAVFTKSGEDLITCFCREITAEKQELKRVKDSEELLRSIISESEIVMLNITPEGSILYSNRFFKENFDFHESNFYNFIEKRFRTGFSLPLTRTSNLEIPLISHGTVRYFSFSFNPVFSSEGNIQYISLAGADISLLYEKQQELSLFKEIFNHSADGIAVVKTGRIFKTNDAFAALFGYTSKEELRGKRINELSSLEDKDKVFEQINELEISGFSSERFEFSGKKLDGTQFYVSASLSPFSTGNNIYTLMICRDVTERRRTQKAIRESEEKIRTLTENIDDFLFTYEKIDNIQKPVFYTASVEKITGYTQYEFLQDSRLLLKIIHPDDLPDVKRKLKSLLRSRILNSEELEFRMINRNGNLVWVRNKINITRNDDGSIQRIFGLVSDISLRKKAEDELKRTSDNLIKLNDAKDRFISVVSHDLRTPFSSILGFTDLLLTDEELTEEEKKQYARYIQDSAKSMLSLVNSLLDWTRLQTGRIRFEPEKFSATGVIDEAIRLLSGSAFQKKIELINEVSTDTVIFADKNLLLQAFNNLISNAIKFTKPGGRIAVSTSQSDKIRFLQFSVKDNGVGIQPENLKNLFRVETKFTSEGTAGEKGSGLGLSLVKEIIEKHGGEIWVESEYQKGSDFIFTIPVTPSNILLVDDSTTDRLLYSKLLKNFAPDYNIETASNGKEAYDKIIASPPALIITDHVMPVFNGYELVLQLKKSRLPEMPPLIVLSSEIDRNTISAYNDAGIFNIFQKPVNLVEFKQTVEKLLRKSYQKS
jgi:PAS domain S-box-containing protein